MSDTAPGRELRDNIRVLLQRVVGGAAPRRDLGRNRWRVVGRLLSLVVLLCSPFRLLLCSPFRGTLISRASFCRSISHAGLPSIWLEEQQQPHSSSSDNQSLLCWSNKEPLHMTSSQAFAFQMLQSSHFLPLLALSSLTNMHISAIRRHNHAQL